jgi:APA family basic amino acid/polyamine antiporter
VPWIPALSAVSSVVLMASLPWESWQRLIAWMAIGVVVYFVYGARHSRLRGEEASPPLRGPDAVRAGLSRR